jgi:putative tricarboxylic transport membrane protein
VPLFAAILRIPFSIIAPVIIVICAIGAYTVHNAMFDIWLMLASASWATCSRSSTTRWRRWCWRWCWATRPRTRSARPCWSRRATVLIMFSNPLVGGITTLALVLLFWPLISQGADRRASRRSTTSSPSNGRWTERRTTTCQ